MHLSTYFSDAVRTNLSQPTLIKQLIKKYFYTIYRNNEKINKKLVWQRSSYVSFFSFFNSQIRDSMFYRTPIVKINLFT